MVKDKIILRQVQPPALSATSIVDMPVGQGGNGRRYHKVIIQLGYTSGTNTVAGVAAQIAEIRLVANGGNVIRKVTGAQLLDMNLLNGTAYTGQGVPNTAPGCALTMHFAEPWRDSAADRDALALATAWKGGGLSSLQLQVQLAAAIASASAPTLAVSAVVDSALPETQPGFVKWISTDISASGLSLDTKIDALGILQAIHMYAHDGGTPAKQSKTTVRQGDRIRHELTSSANFAELTGNGMTPTASGRTADMTDVVFDFDDLLRSGLPLQGGPDPILTLEHVTTAATGSIKAIIERLDLI